MVLLQDSQARSMGLGDDIKEAVERRTMRKTGERTELTLILERSLRESFVSREVSNQAPACQPNTTEGMMQSMSSHT